MISDAFGPPPGCTCQNVFGDPRSCPVHEPEAYPNRADAPRVLQVPDAEYLRGRAAGFREGLELALKFVMALGAK